MKRSTPVYSFVKMLKVKDKGRTLEAVRGK